MARVSLIGIVLTAIASPTFASFRDVPVTHPFVEAIEDLQDRGIVQGYANGFYSPDERINRAEFTKILVGALSVGDRAEQCDLSILKRFSDVREDQWYSRFICYATAEGIVRGNDQLSGKPAFLPQAPITVAEAAKMIAVAFSLGDPPMDCSGPKYTGCVEEAKAGNPWYRRHIEALGEKAALPTSLTSFNHAITRGEMAAMIDRILAGTELDSLTYEELLERSTAKTNVEQEEFVRRTATLQSMLNDAGELRIAFTEEREPGVQTLQVLTSQGARTMVTYVERLPNQSIVVPYLTNPDGLLFLAGLGPDTFTVKDLDGVDRTQEHLLFKDRKFSISNFYQIDQRRYAYGVHSADTDDRSNAGLFIQKIGGALQHLSLDAFGLDGLSGVVPLCLSQDGTTLYVRYQGWEGFTYESVWSVRLSDLQVRSIFSPQEKMYSYNCHNRSDRIVAVRTEKNPNAGMGGAPKAPSAIVLFDTFRGTAKILRESQDHLLSRAFITPDGASIVFIEITPKTTVTEEYDDPFFGEGTVSQVWMMSLDGSQARMLGAFDEVLGVSRNGNVLLVKRTDFERWENSEYFVLHSDGRMASLSQYQRMRVIQCGYGEGFDCLY